MSAASPRSAEWHIKGVPDEARMLVDMYVARHRLKRKTGEALRQLIVAGYQALEGVLADDVGNQKQSGTDGADERVSELETAFPKDFSR